jgi:hypothetical protein
MSQGAGEQRVKPSFSVRAPTKELVRPRPQNADWSKPAQAAER